MRILSAERPDTAEEAASTTASRTKVRTVVPGFVSPRLQITHFMAGNRSSQLQPHLHNLGGAEIAAVDHQRRARDPTRRIRGEEDARIRYILDRAEALERARPQHHALDFLVGPDARGCAFGRDRPGSNTVDANPVAAPFTRMRFGELDNAGLRCRIR